jgi:signal transduction histidine kinase
MGMKLNNLKLSTKFTLAVVFILLIFCVIFSFLLYTNLKERVVQDASEKSLIIMTQIGAVGSYVNEVLRPRMFQILPHLDEQDDFIVEAMSTTHVRHEVMVRFNRDLKDYVYNRMSLNPLNKANKADSLHEEMIRSFRENAERTSWNGIVEVKGQECFVRARPVKADSGCLKCHGNPLSAPRGLVKKYGTEDGFGWKEGEIMGVESVTIPLADTLGQIKGIAISTFVFGFGTLLFLFVSLEGAFLSLVGRPLARLTGIFKGIVEGTEPLNQDLPVAGRDEIGELTESFNQMAMHLYNAQEDLKKNAETLHSIFEGISDPVALVNSDCSLEITNTAYREWVGRGISAVFTRECVSRDCDRDAACPACFLDRVFREKRPVSEYWDGGNGHFYYVHFYPVSDGAGNVVKAVHYVKDVTDKMKMEEQLRMADKLAALGQLSAGIAHEINNPLGGVRICFNNLIGTAMDEETRRTHVEVINSGLAKIQDIIGQLLDLSKKSALTVSNVSVNAVIERVLKLTEYLLSKREVTVLKRLSPGLPEIAVDQNKMEQVFLNIILNAVHAMDNGRPKQLTIETSSDDGYCNASFADSGPGISDTVMPHIFEPFFSTKPVGEGTGLGLSVSKSIVEQHGGRIVVQSSAQGARFIVRLPLSS